MAIVSSIGYGGEVTEDNVPLWRQSFPSPYGVVAEGDWKVTLKTGVDRTVKIAAGVGFGHGVRDVNDSVEVTVSLATLTSGTRYDLIVAHRNWSGTGGTTTFDKVTGTSSQTAAYVSRDQTPGTEDDQPLALVQVNGTPEGGVIATIRDVRVWAGAGGLYAGSTDVLQYLTDPGTQARVGDVLYTRVVDGSGVSSWDALDLNVIRAVRRDSSNQTARLIPTGVFGTGAQFAVYDGDDSMAFQVPNPANPESPLTRFRVDSTGELTHGKVPYDRLTAEVEVPFNTGSDGGTGWLPLSGSKIIRRGKHRELWFTARRVGPTITSPSNGNIVDSLMTTLASIDAAPGLVPIHVWYRRDVGASAGILPGFAHLSGTSLYLGALTPNNDLATQASGVPSVYVHAEWYVD